MSHKCSEPGCCFSLPDSYPSSLCPWHAAPGGGLTKALWAAGVLAVGVGGAYAYTKIRDAIRAAADEGEAVDDASERPQPRDGATSHTGGSAMSDRIDHYKILGVQRSASLDEIEAAYRDSVLKHHPDRGGDAWAFPASPGGVRPP